MRKDGDWLLGIKSLIHSHPMAENPFEYSEHLRFNLDYEKTLAEAGRLRMTGVIINKPSIYYQKVPVFVGMPTGTIIPDIIVLKLVK